MSDIVPHWLLRTGTKHVVQFSGGTCSWAAAKRVAERHGTENMILLFADTKYEDEDTYRYLEEAAINVGAPLVKIADGRDPWQVFRDERMLGSSRFDPCSKILKRQLLDRWMKVNCDPATTIRYVGIHWSEADRYERLRDRMTDWNIQAPMCETPFMGVADMEAWSEREGLKRQRLYVEGFPHANCGGRCVKQGQAGWARLYKTRPESYLECERKEQEMRDLLGDVSMMREQVNKVRRPLTLAEFRFRLDLKQAYDKYDEGGCGCFSGAVEADS